MAGVRLLLWGPLVLLGRVFRSQLKLDGPLLGDKFTVKTHHQVPIMPAAAPSPAAMTCPAAPSPPLTLDSIHSGGWHQQACRDSTVAAAAAACGMLHLWQIKTPAAGAAAAAALRCQVLRCCRRLV